MKYYCCPICIRIIFAVGIVETARSTKVQIWITDPRGTRFRFYWYIKMKIICQAYSLVFVYFLSHRSAIEMKHMELSHVSFRMMNFPLENTIAFIVNLSSICTVSRRVLNDSEMLSKHSWNSYASIIFSVFFSLSVDSFFSSPHYYRVKYSILLIHLMIKIANYLYNN